MDQYSGKPEPKIQTTSRHLGHHHTTNYSQTVLLRIVRLVAMATSSLLPILAIVVLPFIQSIGWRLFAVAGFTFLFALVVGILTHGQPIDIFAAAAAFAAVQVVFVGSTN